MDLSIFLLYQNNFPVDKKNAGRKRSQYRPSNSISTIRILVISVVKS